MAEKCESCGRVLPKAKPEDDPGPKRKIFSVSVPRGEEGILEELCEQVVEKYKAGAGEHLLPVGEKMWKYYAVHYALYQAAVAPGPLVSEEGG